MKKILLLPVLLSAFLFSQAQLEKAEFQASGLTCSMCSNAINKALKTIPFIESVETDLNKNLFSIRFKKNMAVDLDQIKQKVENAGFSVAAFWVVVKVHDLAVASDKHVSVDGINFHFLHVPAQTLNGDQRLQVLDKDFVSSKTFKKNRTYTALGCYETGRMAACCPPGTTTSAGTRIFHVTI